MNIFNKKINILRLKAKVILTKINKDKIVKWINDNKIKIIVGCTILMLFSLVFINIKPVSKDDALLKFRKSLLDGNEKSLAKCIRVNNEEVPAQNLKPLIKYYNGNNSMVDSVVNNLKQKGKSGVFTLESEKKFLKQNYYISTEVVKVEFINSLKNVKVELGDKKYNLDKKSQYFILPGEYNITYTLKTMYGDINKSENITVMEDKKINVDLNAKFITLYTNFEDADVYIDGKKTNLKASDIKNFGPIPEDNNLKLFIEKEFPWGTIRSEEVSLDKEKFININIDMLNEELNSIISNIINSFYNSTFEALNNKNKELILNTSNSIKDKVYNYIKKDALLFSNSYDITDMKVEIEKSDFKFEDATYKASVLTKLNYNISKKLFPFLKNTNEEYFLLSLEYKENRFIINEIEKIDI